MDFLKKAAASAGHSNTNTNNEAGAPAGAPAGGAPPAQQKDYGDKAFDQVLNRTGYGGKVSDSNREKITDTIRGQYEKATGKQIDPKYSN